MARYDLLIAGAGVGGCILATLCAREGMKVILAERSPTSKVRPVETAPAQLRHLLSSLGLASVVDFPTCVEATGVISVWGSDVPLERSYFLSPFGPGLHIDRGSFGALLLKAAADAGADIRVGEEIREVHRSGRSKSVVFSSGTIVETSHIALAFGRSTSPSQLGYRRISIANLVAVGGMFSSNSLADHRTLIEAIPGGWFYAAEISDGRSAVMFVTLADSIPSGLRQRFEWWKEHLARSKLLAEKFNPPISPMSISTFDARTSVVDVNTQRDWFAIGDARFAPDPLSGQGILWAVDDARFVSELFCSGRENIIHRELHDRSRRDLAMHSAAARNVYLSERRFRGDQFWRTLSST
jgi:flavin-dependent dehydrogenase